MRVMVDMMRNHYGTREVVIQQDMQDPMTGETIQQEMPVMLDFGTLDLDVTEINVDVGEASYWSRICLLYTSPLSRDTKDFREAWAIKVQYDRLIEEARREENLRDMAWQTERASG